MSFKSKNYSEYAKSQKVDKNTYNQVFDQLTCPSYCKEYKYVYQIYGKSQKYLILDINMYNNRLM